MARRAKKTEDKEQKTVAKEKTPKKPKLRAVLEIEDDPEDGAGDDEDHEDGEDGDHEDGEAEPAAAAAAAAEAASIDDPIRATGRPVSVIVQRQLLASCPLSEAQAYLQTLPESQRPILLEVPPDEVDGLTAIRTKEELEAIGFIFVTAATVDTRAEKQLPLAAHVDHRVELAECRFIYTDTQEGVRVELTEEERRQLLERSAAHAATIVRLQTEIVRLKGQLKDLKADQLAQERDRDRCFAAHRDGFEVRDCRTRYYLTPQRMVVEATEVRPGQIEISRPRFPRAEEDGKIERASRGPLFGEKSLDGEDRRTAERPLKLGLGNVLPRR